MLHCHALFKIYKIKYDDTKKKNNSCYTRGCLDPRKWTDFCSFFVYICCSQRALWHLDFVYASTRGHHFQSGPIPSYKWRTLFSSKKKTMAERKWKLRSWWRQNEDRTSGTLLIDRAIAEIEKLSLNRQLQLGESRNHVTWWPASVT